jgi:hypothetical protein
MSKKNMTKKKVKKELRNTLHQKLSLALEDYKNILQEKKYERSLKRASRLLTSDILGAMNKEAKLAAKKPPKKNSKA